MLLKLLGRLNFDLLNASILDSFSVGQNTEVENGIIILTTYRVHIRHQTQINNNNKTHHCKNKWYISYQIACFEKQRKVNKNPSFRNHSLELADNHNFVNFQ